MPGVARSQDGDSDPPALTTAGSEKTGARCSSQSGSAAASSSRNATTSPVAAEIPALRAPESPCGSVFSTSTTEPSGHAPRARSSSAWLWSTDTITWCAGCVCPWTEATASRSASQRSSE